MLRRFVGAAIVRSEASYPGVPRAGGVVTGAFAAAPWCIVRTNVSSTQSGALTPLRCGLERHFVRASLREPRQLGQFLAAAAQGAGSTDRARGVTSTALNAGPANSIARVDPARPSREAENPRDREVRFPRRRLHARRRTHPRRDGARLTRRGFCGPRPGSSPRPRHETGSHRGSVHGLASKRPASSLVDDGLRAVDRPGTQSHSWRG